MAGNEHRPYRAIHGIQRWIQVFPCTESKDGYKYFLVVMDNFTKFVILLPCRNVDEVTTAALLFYDIFMMQGFPSKIVSDKGTAFLNKVFKRLMELLALVKMKTATNFYLAL